MSNCAHDMYAYDMYVCTSHKHRFETLNVCEMPLISKILKFYPRSPCFLSLGLCALSVPYRCSSS
jgi:hypothetical protein